MTSTQKLLMIGASVRAAAHSARHYQLRTCDLFADYDLQQVADASMLPAEKFPKGFADWARKQKDTTEWMYTGGLENYPDIIQEIADRHPLLGSNSVSVRSVRDPFQFMKFVEWTGIPGVLATSVVRCDEHLPGRQCPEAISFVWWVGNSIRTSSSLPTARSRILPAAIYRRPILGGTVH